MAAFSIVITGGPGSGKTSICEYLKEKSYQTYPENARRLIKEGIRPPIAITNSAQLSSFGDKVLKNRISDYKDSLKYELCFFDRGIPDGLAFSYFMNKQADQTLINAIDNYRYDQIFILTPWREIYCQDSVRKESYEIAYQIYSFCLKAYNDSGYRLIEVPQLSVAERATFILNKLHKR